VFHLSIMHTFLLTAAAVASLFNSAIAAPKHTATVETSSGTLIGHQASNKTQVTEFLGIRYAQAPVGELRFAAPMKYAAPTGTVFEASEWVCIPIIPSKVHMLTTRSPRRCAVCKVGKRSNQNTVTALRTSPLCRRSQTSRSHLACVCGRTSRL
jgi:hypothetical protein